MPSFSGHLHLRAARRGHGRTVLAAQSFRAPFHLSKPYWDEEVRVLLAQVVNPTAGILDGDRLESEIAVDAGASLLVTTPSASRVFQMRGGAAECRQQFTVASDGWLEVLPEPLVPHRGARYRQITTIDAASGSALFFVDQLMPGRVAHGDAWQWERLQLELSVRLDGELVLRERLDQSGVELHALAELADSSESACFANGVLIAPPTEGPAAWTRELAALHGSGLWVGVSTLRRGGWSIRIIASDAVRLRQALRDARRILARSFPRLACDTRKL
jgi:urease accessory protein